MVVGIMDKVMYVAGVVGLMTVGAMIATMVGITTPLQFQDGAVVLQDVLDGIFPSMIPFGIAMLFYWLLKKKVSPIAIIIGMFAIGIVGHLIGLL